MLGLDTEGRGLFLPQFDMPSFVDSIWRNYTLQGVDGGCKELGRRGRKGKCGWYKIEFKKIKKNKDKIWMCRKVGLMLEEKQTG